jgi:hypothetical protein
MENFLRIFTSPPKSSFNTIFNFPYLEGILYYEGKNIPHSSWGIILHSLSL